MTTEKFEEFIQGLACEELDELRQAMTRGHTRMLVENRIRLFTNPTLVCPVCEKDVTEEEDIVMTFGPREFRQKARFCGYDCLQYFVQGVHKNLNKPMKN